MPVAAESGNSLHMEECDFNEPVFSKSFYVDVFSCINCPLNAKYITGKLVVK